MTVGYRSFLVVDGGESVVKPIAEHVSAWTESIDIHLPADQPGYHKLDEENEIIVQHEKHRGSGIYRWRWYRPGVGRPGALTRLSVTALEEVDGDGWLWVEVEVLESGEHPWSARTSFAPVPPFIPAVLSEVACYDSRTPMTAFPMWAGREHIPDLMDYLADEDRRGPVFVASQDTRLPAEFQEWADEAMCDIVGLGVMFLLNRQVEREFNEMVGPRHAVGPGGVRTYLPGVDLDDSHDHNRHLVLSVSRIGRSSGREVSHLLGAAQRSRLSQLPVPHEAIEVDRMLQEREEHARRRSDWVADLGSATTVARTEPSERAQIQAEQIAELRVANAHLRADLDVLTDRLEHVERCQEVVLRALRDAQQRLPSSSPGAPESDGQADEQQADEQGSEATQETDVDDAAASETNGHGAHADHECGDHGGQQGSGGTCQPGE